VPWGGEVQSEYEVDGVTWSLGLESMREFDAVNFFRFFVFFDFNEDDSISWLLSSAYPLSELRMATRRLPPYWEEWKEEFDSSLNNSLKSVWREEESWSKEMPEGSRIMWSSKKDDKGRSGEDGGEGRDDKEEDIAAPTDEDFRFIFSTLLQKMSRLLLLCG
jgi:hypothetical protein